MPQISHNPHDLNFKSLMSEFEFLKHFLKSYLPNHLLEKINLNNLKISKPNKKNLEPKTNQAFEADVIFLLKSKTQDKNQDQKYLLFIHVEHQASSDKNMLFRMANYQTAQIASHMQDNLDQNEAPPVISFIYYQGVQPWRYKNKFSELSPGFYLGPESFLGNSIFLIDLAATPDEILKTHEGIGEIEIFLKYIRHKDYKNKLKNILPGLQQCSDRIREMLLKYLLSVTDFSESEFLEIIENCLPKDEGIAMTLAERLIEKGLKKGLEQGLEQGVEKGLQEGKKEGLKEVARRLLLADQSANFIREATGLSLKVIAQLRKDLTH